MRTISAGTGATGLDLQYLRRDFEAVFGSVPGSADDVAIALQAINTLLGLTGEDLQEAARQALLLQDATGADLETVISKAASRNEPVQYRRRQSSRMSWIRCSDSPRTPGLGLMDYRPSLADTARR